MTKAFLCALVATAVFVSISAAAPKLSIPACFKHEGLVFQTTEPGGGWSHLAGVPVGPGIQLTGKVGYAVYFGSISSHSFLLALVGTNVTDAPQILGPSYLLPGPPGVDQQYGGWGVAWTATVPYGRVPKVAKPTAAEKNAIAICVSGRADT